MPEQTLESTITPHQGVDIALLPQSVQYIVNGVYANRDRMSPELARQIVQNSGVKQEDLMHWADYEHPVADSYGRKLLFNGVFFEIMVMSWQPGDFSAIHDHGYTLWGAVKVFGPAEHAAFMISDQMMTTVAREIFEVDRVVAVGHELVHQLGNPTKDQQFLSLHMYGLYDSSFSLASVTCDARVVDLTRKEVERVDGGMFFDLPENQIKIKEECPAPDFHTWLRHTIEYIRRLHRMDDPSRNAYKRELIDQINHGDNFQWLERELFRFVDENGHMTQPYYYELLRYELIQGADLQAHLEDKRNDSDRFHTYAELYDEVIGKPCLEDFMANYIDFIHKQKYADLTQSELLSIGCGTGIMEEHIFRTYSTPRTNILGIDVSEAMVSEASGRIPARKINILEMNSGEKQYDVTFQGLNVFQYLDADDLEVSIRKTAELTKSGGIFFGDFVTTDHIRWYPHIIRSENVISLRKPRLVEKNKKTYQESEIINVSRLDGSFRITYEGKHLRYLPPIIKVRRLFEKYFGRSVEVFDAVSLEALPEDADTTPSTRYLVIARKD